MVQVGVEQLDENENENEIEIEKVRLGRRDELELIFCSILYNKIRNFKFSLQLTFTTLNFASLSSPEALETSLLARIKFNSNSVLSGTLARDLKPDIAQSLA